MISATRRRPAAFRGVLLAVCSLAVPIGCGRIAPDSMADAAATADRPGGGQVASSGDPRGAAGSGPGGTGGGGWGGWGGTGAGGAGGTGGGSAGTGGQAGAGPTAAYYAALSYSPAHNRLAVASSGGVKLFDATSGTKLSTLDAGLGIAMIVRQGGNAIAASLLGNLWLYDAGGTLHHTLVFDGQIFSFALATDGQVLFVGGALLRRFRVSEGTEILPPIHDGRYREDSADSLQASPDGRYLAAAVGDGVRIWRLMDATAVVTLPGKTRYLAFAPDGRRLVASQEPGVHIYAVPEGERVFTLAGDLGGERVAYSSDGRWVAVSGPRDDGTLPEPITLFDAQTGLDVRLLTDPSPLAPHEQSGFRDVSEMVFVGEGTRLVVAFRSGRLASWRVPDGALLWSRLDSDPN